MLYENKSGPHKVLENGRSRKIAILIAKVPQIAAKSIDNDKIELKIGSTIGYLANLEDFAVNALEITKLRTLISLRRLRKVVRFLLVLNLEVLGSFLRCIFVNLLYQNKQSQYFL